MGKIVVPRLRESRLLTPSGREFTQPRARSFAQPCIFRSSPRSSTSGHYRENMDEVDNDLLQRGSGAQQPIVRGPPPHMRPQSYMKATTNRESNYPVS